MPDTDDIPAVLIIRPADGATLPLGEPFVVEAAVRDLATGSFADPQAEYLQVPQRLNEDGLVFGHAHVVVQPLPSEEDGEGTTEIPEARNLVYFQGLEEPADEDGRLRATVPGLDEPGVYRIQVNTSSTGHQPIVPPVAEQVAPVDVIRVRVAAATDDMSPTDTEAGAGGPVTGPESDPVLAAAPAANEPGDGIPPAPGTGEAAGGGGAGPGDGGAGDGRPPAPASSDAATSGPATGGASGGLEVEDRDVGGDAAQVSSDGFALPFTGSEAADVLLLATGVMVAIGLTLVAVGRRRGRRPSRSTRPSTYQGRHLDEDRRASGEWPSLDALLDDEAVGGEPDATHH